MRIESYFLNSNTSWQGDTPSPTNSKTQAIANNVLASLPTIGLLDPFSIGIGIGFAVGVVTGVGVALEWLVESEKKEKGNPKEKSLCTYVKEAIGTKKDK